MSPGVIRRGFAFALGLGTLAAAPVPVSRKPSPSPLPSSLPSPSLAPSPSPQAAAGVSPAPSPIAVASSPSPSIADVAKRFAGVWRCDAYSNDESSNVSYLREGTAVVSLVGTLDSGKTVSERFAYDGGQNTWVLTTSSSALKYAALPESSERWIFSASDDASHQRRPARIVYTMLGPAAFRREHQFLSQNLWVDDAETVCRRTAEMSVSAAPVPSRSPAPPARKISRPFTRERDRAYHLVGGTWECETIAGNSAPHTYTRAHDGSIQLHTVLTEGGKSYALDERYQFDPAPNAWTETTLGTTYSATAPPWFGEKWTFDGFATVNGKQVPQRMIYTDLGGRAFRRDFRQQRGTEWETIASETCTRAK